MVLVHDDLFICFLLISLLYFSFAFFFYFPYNILFVIIIINKLCVYLGFVYFVEIKFFFVESIVEKGKLVEIV